METGFLDRLASQLKVNETPTGCGAIQRILVHIKEHYESGQYQRTETPHPFENRQRERHQAVVTKRFSACLALHCWRAYTHLRLLKSNPPASGYGDSPHQPPG
jgi:hypothetical protein